MKENVSAFGGDPESITIGGESVGAQSVSAHLASPLSRGLFSRAIAESGSILDIRSVISPLEESEKIGLEVSRAAKTDGIQHLRSLSAKELLKIANRGNPRRFIPTIDGKFLKENPLDIFSRRDQAQVPLLVGWNADEVPYLGLFRLRRLTSKNYLAAIAKLHGNKSPEVAALYPATTRAELKIAGARFISDYAINYGSWNLADLHASSENAPVYRYLFAHPHPGLSDYQLSKGNPLKIAVKKMINKIIKGSAFHASEIEYALRNLTVQPNFAWGDVDFQVSTQIQGYFVNFIKTGNPNGLDENKVHLTAWPRFIPIGEGQVLRIGEYSHVEVDSLRSRYLSLRRIADQN